MEYFNRLPLAVRRRFVQITRRGQDATLIHGSRDGYVWVLLLMLAVVPTAATGLVMGALAGSWLAVPLMAALLGLGIGLMVAAVAQLYPTHPFAAGKWAFADCAIDCRANTFKVVRFSANTVFQPYARTTRTRTRQGNTWRTDTAHYYGVRILTRNITQLTLTMKSEAAATSVAHRLDQARREFLGAWDRGDHPALRRMTPFYEHLVGQPLAPAEATQAPLMRRIPLPLRAIGVGVVLGAVALGGWAGHGPIRARAESQADATRASAEFEDYEADQAALAKELAESAAASDEARKFLERMFDNSSASDGILYVDFQGDVFPTTGVPNEARDLFGASYEGLDEIMTKTLAQRLPGWVVQETFQGAGPVIWVHREGSPSSSRHQTLDGEVAGLTLVFDATVHWRTDDDDSWHEPSDVMMKVSITTQPPSTLPTTLSAHDTFTEMLKAEHEEFAAELIYRLVKRGAGKKPAKTKKRKKKGKK